MNRLTIRYPDGAVELKCSVNDAVMYLADYEDTGLDPEEFKSVKETWDLFGGADGIQGAYTERDKYKQAESEGRLIVLPCKVGDTLYILRGDVSNGFETIKPTHVEEVRFRLVCLNREMELYPFYYLTREEAEAALGGEPDV